MGKYIPHYPDGTHVTAIDLSPAMLKRARQVRQQYSEKEVRLLEMDAQELNFADDSCDDVVAPFAVCSVPDSAQGFRESLRVTRSGGTVHVSEHMRTTTRALGRLMDTVDASVRWLVGVHVARWTDENVQRTGWAVQRVISLHRMDVCRRIQGQRPL